MSVWTSVSDSAETWIYDQTIWDLGASTWDDGTSFWDGAYQNDWDTTSDTAETFSAATSGTAETWATVPADTAEVWA